MDENVTVKIVGISGTPVKGGNCDIAVQSALESAALLPGVETEFITLAEKEIAACKHCQYCIENRVPCRFQDDSKWIIEKMAEADGIILGAPVWSHVIPPHLMNLISRCRFHAFMTGDFRNKVLGTVTVCWLGVGEEFALMTMEAMTLNYLMIPVARGWGKVSTAAHGERPNYTEKGILDDSTGMLRIRLVGTRVAEIAAKLKYADIAGIGLPPEEQRSITCGKFPLWQQRRKIASGK